MRQLWQHSMASRKRLWLALQAGVGKKLAAVEA